MSRKTRKLIWSAPLVAVLAVAGVLALFMMPTPNAAQAQTINVPGMPGNLVAAPDGPTRIELTWDEPSAGGEAIGFRIDVSDDGKTWRSLETSHPDPRYVHEGLMARTTQHYRVFAFNADGTSMTAGPIAETTTKSTKPDAPTDLSLEVGAGTAPAPAPQEAIVLTWEAPDDPDGAPVTHYRIQHSRTGDRWANLESKIAIDKLTEPSGGMYSHTDDGLLEHQNWYYRVYAINSEGESTASNSPNLSTTDGQEPGTPQNLIAGVNPNSSVIWLYWDEPADTALAAGGPGNNPDGAPITGYLIQGAPRTADGGDFEDWSADPTENMLVQVGETTDFEITNSEINKIKVDGEAVDHWQFRVIAVNSVVERGLDDPDIKVAQLSDDSPDEFNATSAIVVDTKADDLLQPPTGLDADRDTTVNSGRTSINLEWSEPANIGDATPTYRVEFSTDRIEWTIPAADDWETTDGGSGDADAVSGSLEGAHSNRIAGTKYYYRVFANQAAASVYTWASNPIATETTAPALRPEKPTDLTAATISHTRIDLTWTPPTDIGDGRITGYLIETSADGSSWSDLATIGPKEDRIYTYDGAKVSDRAGGAEEVINFEHTKLMPGMEIHYRVSTINNAPTSQRTSRPSSSVVGMTEPASEPDAPGGLVVHAAGRTVINLVWNEQSADTAAAPTSGYRVDISDDGGKTWSTLEEDTGNTETMYSDSTLSPGMTRHYRVYAINSVGTSPGFTGFGDGIDATNDNDAMAMAVEAMVPGAPTLTLGTVTDTEINFSWTAPADDGGSAITGWIVEKAYGGSFLDEMRTNTDAFTDAQTWWDGLDCPAMVAAVMDDGTADMDNPFCAMYADLGDTEETEVERVFDVRYFVIDDATANTYRNFNLQPETERMYRLAAVNGVGLGMWSEPVTATTLAAMPPELTAPTGVTVSSLQNTVSVTWDPASIENADQVKAVLFDDGVTMIVDLKTFNAASDPGAATFTGVDSGTYKVTVASFRMGEPHKLSALMEVTIP